MALTHNSKSGNAAVLAAQTLYLAGGNPEAGKREKGTRTNGISLSRNLRPE